MALHQCSLHKKSFFPLKRTLLGESQRPVKRLSNQISSFRLEAHLFFSFFDLRESNSYVTPYNSRFFRHGIISPEFVSKWSFSFWEQQWKHSVSVIFEKRSYPSLPSSNYVPAIIQSINIVLAELLVIHAPTSVSWNILSPLLFFFL